MFDSLVSFSNNLANRKTFFFFSIYFAQKTFSLVLALLTSLILNLIKMPNLETSQLSLSFLSWSLSFLTKIHLFSFLQSHHKSTCSSIGKPFINKKYQILLAKSWFDGEEMRLGDEFPSSRQGV